MKLPFLADSRLGHLITSITILPVGKQKRRKTGPFRLEFLETRLLLTSITEFAASSVNGGITSQGGRLWLTRPSDIAMIDPSNPTTHADVLAGASDQSFARPAGNHHGAGQ